MVLLAPFLLRNGIPAYIHDWSWPPDAAGLRDATIRGIAAWLPDGLGTPNAFPTILPQFYLEWLLSWVLPSKVVLDLVLLATFTLGILGGAFAARILGATSVRWAVLCGFFYMAGPVVLVKFVAGHIPYLEGYASFPFFLGLVLSARIDNRRLWLVLSALALAFSTVQLQLFGLELLTLAAAMIFGKRTFKEGAAILCVALPLLIPAMLGPLFLSQATHGALSMQRAVLSWQLQQSVPPLEAFEGRGYFVHYYELLTQFWLQHVLLLFPLCALFALSQMRREIRTAALLGALALFAWLTVTGLRGPLHGLWSAAFTHLPVSSVYRELYDVMALYWLVCVVLATRFMASQRAIGVILALFGLWATLPAWYNVSTLFGWAPSSAVIERLNVAAQGLPHGRILWWPSQQPLGPPHRQVGGADPLAYTPLAGDQPIFEYQPYGLFAAALTQAQRGAWNEAESLFSRLGIAAIVDRSDLASFVSGRPQAARRVPRDARTRFIAQFGDFRLLRLVETRPSLSLQQAGAFTEPAKPFEHSVLNNSPGLGRFVAAYPYYWMTASIGLCGASSVLGYREDFLRARRPWYFIAPISSERGCHWIRPSSLAHMPSEGLLVAGGWSDHRVLDSVTTSPGKPMGHVSVERAGSDEIEGSFEAPRSGVLIFRSNFDPRWTLTLDGHSVGARLVDDFANGWAVPRGVHSFTLQFSPARYLRVALAASFVWLILLLSEAFRQLGYSRRGAATH